MTRVVGYTREVTPGAGTATDAGQLVLAGAERVFTDDGSIGGAERPGLRECLEFVEAGDTVIVTSAAMLTPTAAQFLTVVSELAGRSVGFRSLAERRCPPGRPWIQPRCSSPSSRFAGACWDAT